MLSSSQLKTELIVGIVFGFIICGIAVAVGVLHYKKRKSIIQNISFYMKAFSALLCPFIDLWIDWSVFCSVKSTFKQFNGSWFIDQLEMSFDKMRLRNSTYFTDKTVKKTLLQSQNFTEFTGERCNKQAYAPIAINFSN